MQYKLLKEVKFGSEVITEVEIKEDYDCGDFARIQNAAKKGDGDIFLELLSVGTGLPLPKVTKICAKDGMQIVTKVKDFLGLGEMSEDTSTNTSP